MIMVCIHIMPYLRSAESTYHNIFTICTGIYQYLKLGCTDREFHRAHSKTHNIHGINFP